MDQYLCFSALFREALHLPEDAISFLLRTLRANQFFDDVADGDAVKRDDLNIVLWDFFIGYASDPFFLKHRANLVPVLANSIMKWQASDMAERAGEASAKSYMWRAVFYDVIMAVVLLVHGPEQSVKLSKVVMDAYGETFEDYVKEFPRG